MLQLIRRITADPDDSTKCSLIFANQVSSVFCCLRISWRLLIIVALPFFISDRKRHPFEGGAGGGEEETPRQSSSLVHT